MIYLTPPNYVGGSPGSADRRAGLTLGSPSNDTVLRCGPGFSFVYFDPRRSSPNQMIGIRSGRNETLHIIAPGECAPIDPAQAYVRVSKVGWKTTNNNAWILLGFGTAAELPLFTSRRRAAPMWPFHILEVSKASVGPVEIETTGLRGVRIIAHPLDGAGAIIDPAPADFAVQLVPTYLDAGGLRDSSDLNPCAVGSANLADSAVALIGDGVQHQAGDPASLLSFDPAQLVQTFEVPVGAPMVEFVAGALAGTGVVDAVFTFEGEPYY